MKKYIIRILLLVVAIFIAFLVFISTTDGILGDCVTDEITSTVNSTNQYEAKVYKRDCGATTSIVTIVAIKKMEHESEFQEVFIVEGDFQIIVHWINSTELLISMSSNASFLNQDSIYKKVLNLGNIKITYKY